MANASRSAPQVVGVLALQGSVEPHAHKLAQCGSVIVSVRQPRQLADVTHLLVPGGESTTIAKLCDEFDLTKPIAERARAGSLAIFGTCAGAILVGAKSDERPPRWGLIDVETERNAFGRQVDSFVDALTFHGALAGTPTCDGVFIRAPRFVSVGPDVEILARWRDEPVLVRQNRTLAATFHPELTERTEIHEYFLSL